MKIKMQLINPKIIYIGFLFLATFFTAGKAQIVDNASGLSEYTLEQCIEYAIDRNENLKKLELNIKSAEVFVNENRSIGLPQLTANAQFVNNFKVQKSILPDGTLFGGPPGPLAVEFQPQFSGNIYLNYQQIILDYSYFIGIKAAKAFESLTQKQTLPPKVDIAENVSKAYYGVLVSKERLGLLNQNYTRLDSLLNETAVLYKNGFVEKIDVDRIQVSFNNLKSEKQKVERLIEFSYQILKYQMAMPLTDSLVIAGSLKELNLDTQLINAEADYKNRIEHVLLQENKALLALDVRYRKALRYPKLSGFANIGVNTAATRLGDIGNLSDKWFQYGNFGINLSIPILTGFRNKFAIDKAKIELEKVQYDYDLFARTVSFQTAQAKTNLRNALNDFEIQKTNMALALEVSRVARVKYQNGIGTNLEIINAETSFKEAETNYYNALYNAAISLVDLKKALGILYTF